MIYSIKLSRYIQLKEEDSVLSFFPEYETMMTPRYLRQMTVKHLLTMTSGTKCNETTTVVETDWVNEMHHHLQETYLFSAFPPKKCEAPSLPVLFP